MGWPYQRYFQRVVLIKTRVIGASVKIGPAELRPIKGTLFFIYNKPVYKKLDSTRPKN